MQVCKSIVIDNEIQLINGEYEFLKNYYVHPFEWLNKYWKSAEQAIKFCKENDKNWSINRENYFSIILRAKFSDPHLKNLLVSTNTANILVNSADPCLKHNKLGYLLTLIRMEFNNIPVIF